MEPDRFQELERAELIKLLVEGLGSGHRATFEFFRRRVEEVCADLPNLRGAQANYVAGVLTQFSLKSVTPGRHEFELPSYMMFKEFQNDFVPPTPSFPPKRFESIGRILLFWGSFEEDYVRQRLGEQLLARAGELLFLKAAVGEKRDLLIGISDNFRIWLRHLRFLKYRLVRPRQITPLIIMPKNLNFI